MGVLERSNMHIYSHTYTWGQFRVSNQANVHVFGGTPPPDRHWENSIWTDWNQAWTLLAILNKSI